MIPQIFCNWWHSIFYPAAHIEVTLKQLKKYLLPSSWYKGYFANDDVTTFTCGCWYKGYFATDDTISSTQLLTKRKQLLTQYLPHSCWYRGYFAAVDTISSTQLLIQRILCSCWHNIIYLAADTKDTLQVITQNLLLTCWFSGCFPSHDATSFNHLLIQNYFATVDTTYFTQQLIQRILCSWWHNIFHTAADTEDTFQLLTQHPLPSI